MTDNKKNTTIIFSYNRALQIDLCLRTLLFCCEDIQELSDINVLYKVDENHRESYEMLKKDYPQINFAEETSFKSNLLSFLPGKTSILFVCDDAVFTEKFLLAQVLEDINSNQDFVGFSLRLGKNTKLCYPFGDANQAIPDMKKIRKNHNVYSYQWKPAELDFSYPLEVSASVYRMKDVKSMLENMDYYSPNTLEAAMVTNLDYFVVDKPLLLCFDISHCFSNPINKVQSYNDNRHGDVNPEDLLNYFMNGKRIDSSTFYHYVSNGAHELMDFQLVERCDEPK